MKCFGQLDGFDCAVWTNKLITPKNNRLHAILFDSLFKEIRQPYISETTSFS